MISVENANASQAALAIFRPWHFAKLGILLKNPKPDALCQHSDLAPLNRKPLPRCTGRVLKAILSLGILEMYEGRGPKDEPYLVQLPM